MLKIHGNELSSDAGSDDEDIHDQDDDATDEEDWLR